MQNKDGSYLISSESGALLARKALDEAEAWIERYTANPEYVAMAQKSSALREALNDYVLSNHQDKNDAFETDEWRATPVRGVVGKWNADKLRKLAPKNIFLRLVDYVPNSHKIEEAVRAGTIDRQSIEAAYETEPRSPYVKWTRKSKHDASVEAEAIRSAMSG